MRAPIIQTLPVEDPAKPFRRVDSDPSRRYYRRTLKVPKVLVREPRLMVPRQKPVGPVKIDRSHPFGRRALLCLPLTPVTRNLDLVKEQFATATGNPTFGVYSGVYGVDFNGSSQGLSIPLDLSKYGSVTVITRLNFDTTGLRIIWEHTAAWDGNAGGIGGYLDGNPALGTVGGHRLGANKNAKYVGTYPATGYWQSLCITYDSKLAAANEIELYRDGALLASTLAGAPNNADTSGVYANSTFYIGSRNDAQYWLDGKLEYLYVLEGALISSQVFSLMNDPYQFLIPA